MKIRGLHQKDFMSKRRPKYLRGLGNRKSKRTRKKRQDLKKQMIGKKKITSFCDHFLKASQFIIIYMRFAALK